MEQNEKADYARKLLQQKAEELGRLPKKSDFSPETVCMIKQKLGPWPRALEAAELKEPPLVSSGEKSRLKRERRRKIRKAQQRAEAKNASSEQNNGGDHK